MKTLILINVGTPDSTDPQDVGRYLNQFLMDKNIIPLARPFRDILVKGIIVPRRKYASAEKYKTVWTDEGSPLMVESISLQQALQNKLGAGWKVRLGMQVGNPALKEAISEALKTEDEIIFVPLYPQFAMATSGGAIELIEKMMPKNRVHKIVQPFFAKKWFIEAQAARIREVLNPGDHLLLSYHGLPVSQLSSYRKACGSANCCQQATACIENCYKAQCLETSELLKTEMQIESLSIGFQSRLGRSKWIEPATQALAVQLAQQGVKKLKVACPSFVSDCLETLEEIGHELKKDFLDAGGEEFALIPCVNSAPDFVAGLAKEIET